jgi:hypothetical protein
MVTKGAKRNVKVNVSLSANTVELIERLQQDLPAGNLPDMIRYLMLRGAESILAERAKRAAPADSKP